MRHRRFFKTLLALFLVLALLGTAACGGKKDDGEPAAELPAAEATEAPPAEAEESKPEVRETEAEIVEVPNDIIPVYSRNHMEMRRIPVDGGAYYTYRTEKDGEIRGLYKGQLDASNRAEGIGAFTSDEGTYIGEWRDGVPNGRGIFLAAEDETSDAVVEYVEGDFVDGRLVKGLRSFRDFQSVGEYHTDGRTLLEGEKSTLNTDTNDWSYEQGTFETSGRLLDGIYGECEMSGTEASYSCGRLTADDDGNIVKELKAEKTVGADTPDVWIVSTFENHDLVDTEELPERQDPEFYRNPASERQPLDTELFREFYSEELWEELDYRDAGYLQEDGVNKLAGVNGMYYGDPEKSIEFPDPVVFLAIDDRENAFEINSHYYHGVIRGEKCFCDDFIATFYNDDGEPQKTIIYKIDPETGDQYYMRVYDQPDWGVASFDFNKSKDNIIDWNIDGGAKWDENGKAYTYRNKEYFSPEDQGNNKQPIRGEYLVVYDRETYGYRVGDLSFEGSTWSTVVVTKGAYYWREGERMGCRIGTLKNGKLTDGIEYYYSPEDGWESVTVTDGVYGEWSPSDPPEEFYELPEDFPIHTIE